MAMEWKAAHVENPKIVIPPNDLAGNARKS
jgi:hypothetical protein